MKKFLKFFPVHFCVPLIVLLFINSVCFVNKAAAQPQLTFTPFLDSLAKPIDLKNAGDGSGRLFIVEQDGLVKIYKNGTILPTPFLDISNLVTIGKYKGIISIAFPNNFKKIQTFFVYYLDKNDATVIARYKVSKTNPDSALPNSGVKLLTLAAIDTGDTKVSIGTMNFGKDNNLYISISDGSYIGKVTDNAQNTQKYFGKILRLNVNKNTAPYYSIPPDNPYVNDPDVLSEIWAIGIRNMWRWSFDKLTRDMWLADDGNSNRDEVDYIKPTEPSGANLGWKCWEGDQNFDQSGCTDSNKYKFPIFSIEHDSITGGFAIIGGFVYRGKNYPALKGYYICSDYITENIWKINPNGLGGFNIYRQPGAPEGIVSYGEDESGELYAILLQTGQIFKVGATAAIAKTNEQAANTAAANGNGLKSYVYPTVVDNSTLILELKEAYKSMSLVDMAGHEVVRKTLDNEMGRITLNLPALPAGMYVVQLKGLKNMQQKIYISK